MGVLSVDKQSSEALYGVILTLTTTTAAGMLIAAGCLALGG